MAIVGYIVPILFFVPLVSESAKQNAFAKFHANQQLALLLYWVVIAIFSTVPLLGWVLAPFLYIFGFVLLVLGVLNAANERQKALPLIGKWELIK